MFASILPESSSELNKVESDFSIIKGEKTMFKNALAAPEFGSERGSIMIISRDLYGVKSSGAVWRAKLAEIIRIGIPVNAGEILEGMGSFTTNIC